jgi:hypothetical protein
MPGRCAVLYAFNIKLMNFYGSLKMTGCLFRRRLKKYLLMSILYSLR